MGIERVTRVVAGVPHMSEAQARRLTAHISEHDLSEVLELGFRHGVSSCYIAAHLDERADGGHLTTIDLVGARDADPNIESLLSQLGLKNRVTVIYEPTSYTWRLMRMLEQEPQPRFDLCYLDGAHSWFVDGFALLLVERLLSPGGWIILDDLDWTYAQSPSLRDKIPHMPPDEATTPQVRKVYDLLVKPNPAFDRFWTENGWAFVRKVADPEQPRPVATEYVTIRERYGVGALAKDLARRLRL